MLLDGREEQFQIESWHDNNFHAAMERLLHKTSKTVDVEEGKDAEDLVFACGVVLSEGCVELTQVRDYIAVGEDDALGKSTARRSVYRTSDDSRQIHTLFQKSRQGMPDPLAVPFVDGFETRETFATESSGGICESHHAPLQAKESDHQEYQPS